VQRPGRQAGLKNSPLTVRDHCFHIFQGVTVLTHAEEATAILATGVLIAILLVVFAIAFCVLADLANKVLTKLLSRKRLSRRHDSAHSFHGS
jgi:hypothetical protein